MKKLCFALSVVLIELLVVSGAYAAEDHLVVYTDQNALWLINERNGSYPIRLTSQLPEDWMSYGHPCVAGNYLWYDRTEIHGTQGQRIFRSKWMTSQSTSQMTKDQWGSSNDWNPMVSLFGWDYYFTNRWGETRTNQDSDGSQGPGYGKSILDYPVAACWGVTLADKNIGYLADWDGIYIWNKTKPKTAPVLAFPYGTQGLSVDRVSVTEAGNFLISDYYDLYWVTPGQEARSLGFQNSSQAFVNAEGTRILFVADILPGYRSIFSAYINSAGEVSDFLSLIEVAGNSYDESWPTWAPDSMFFNITDVTVKFNFAKPNLDTLKISGQVIMPEGNYNQITVTLGGFTRTFKLDDPADTLTIPTKPVIGAAKTVTWSVTAKGSLASLFAADGFTNKSVKGAKTPTDITVVFSNSTASDPSTTEASYTETMPLKYTATINKSGTLSD